MTVQVNVSLEPEDAATLDRMAAEDGFDNRSAFVRRMIRQEAIRRCHVIALPPAESIPLEQPA
jgi:metal-responsive CopG/Arc/MetJ family transcriptional regulator